MDDVSAFLCRCGRTFASARGQKYHEMRYCHVTEIVAPAKQLEQHDTRQINSGGEVEKEIQQQGRAEEADSDSFDVENNFTTREILEEKFKFPPLVDRVGNPTEAGFYLFVQTVQRARREGAIAASGGTPCVMKVFSYLWES